MKKIYYSILASAFIISCTGSVNDNESENVSVNKNMKGGCPLGFGEQKSTGLVLKSQGNTNKDWWPNQLDLSVLRQHSNKSNPMNEDFDYKKEFESLDYFALKKDLTNLMTDSKDWWPADHGSYAGFMIRMAWHSAGTYRTGDGRGGSRSGQQRFAPLNSWPDNANLDKARRLLWPIKQKYGRKISWADLMILAGNVAFESAGFETIGYAAGREDVWEPASNIYWGAEKKFLDDDARYDDKRNLEEPLAAVQMGLIYVNPEGPGGNPDPLLAANDIRETFGRMGMNDEETVALIAGGHTLGKTHGAASGENLSASPEGANIEEQGFGWKSSYKSGKGKDAITSGLEVIWTLTPSKWSQGYFKSLFENEWELTKSPGGAHQFEAINPDTLYPDAFDSEVKHNPTMLVTDISLIKDSSYYKISKRFYENPEEFDIAFAKAWFKLTHRDMGPKSSYIGPEIPQEDFIWQDPIANESYSNVNQNDILSLKSQILNLGLTNQELIKTAWASASTYRESDRRGGTNGARISLEPQVNWECNNPTELKKVLAAYKKIKANFDSGNKIISLADLIVLGGNIGVENAAKKAGVELNIPFKAWRGDATAENTDIESFNLLEPMADGFRNYQKKDYSFTSEELLVDKAQLLNLTAPEMTALLGGMRALNVNFDNSANGVLTESPGVLNNSFFVNLLSMDYEWKKANEKGSLFDGYLRGEKVKKWSATRVDLIFGSNSELRAISEVYASEDANEKFINDFAKAWVKIMNHGSFN